MSTCSKWPGNRAAGEHENFREFVDNGDPDLYMRRRYDLNSSSGTEVRMMKDLVVSRELISMTCAVLVKWKVWMMKVVLMLLEDMMNMSQTVPMKQKVMMVNGRPLVRDLIVYSS
jgi:hypothetical protein